MQVSFVIPLCPSQVRMVNSSNTVELFGTSWSCPQAVSKPVWHMPLLCVQWKTPDDGQGNCPKHIEFYSKNKFEKLVHLVGFIIRIYHDARSPERQIWKFVRHTVTSFAGPNGLFQQHCGTVWLISRWRALSHAEMAKCEQKVYEQRLGFDPRFKEGPLRWYNCLSRKESLQGQVVNTYTAFASWIPWSNIKDSAGVIYVLSPYYSLHPPPPARTVLTHLNQKWPISSDGTIFAWNILIFPALKELGVKLINDDRNSHVIYLKI